MAWLFAYAPSTQDGLTVMAEPEDQQVPLGDLCPMCPPDQAWPGDVQGLCQEHYEEVTKK